MEVRKAYEFTLDKIGADISAGPIWQDYIAFLQVSSHSLHRAKLISRTTSFRCPNPFIAEFCNLQAICIVRYLGIIVKGEVVDICHRKQSWYLLVSKGCHSISAGPCTRVAGVPGAVPRGRSRPGGIPAHHCSQVRSLSPLSSPLEQDCDTASSIGHVMHSSNHRHSIALHGA